MFCATKAFKQYGFTPHNWPGAVSFQECDSFARQCGLYIYGTSIEDEVTLFDASYDGPAVVVCDSDTERIVDGRFCMYKSAWV